MSDETRPMSRPDDDYIGGTVNCRDCGLPYREHGLDITLPDSQWALIHQSIGGVLCGTCIARRAAKLPGAVAIRAVIEVYRQPNGVTGSEGANAGGRDPLCPLEGRSANA